MSSINNLVLLTGNVGKDPDVRYNDNGTVVASMVIATDDSYVKDGKKVELTTWHNLSCWGNLAKSVEKMIQKGTNISIAGRNAVDQWEDKDGNKHFKSYVYIHEFRINRGGKKPDNETGEM
jgi:single-strand DNA-binding protein